MRRQLNLRLLIWTVAALVPTVIVVHLLHGYQVRRQAYTLLQRGDLAAENGQPDQALAEYARYLGFVPADNDAREKYVLLLDRTALPVDLPRVVDAMQELLAKRPDLHNVRYRLVHNLIATGRIADAAHELGMLQGHWRDPAEVHHMLGWCQEARGQYREAAASFRAAIAADPARLDSYALLAEVLAERLEGADEAGAVMNAMVEANPKAYRARLIRARYFESRENQAAADQDLDAALALAAAEPAVVLAVAARRQAQGKAAEAYTLLEAGVQQHPDDANLYRAMADLKIRAGDRAAAVEILGRALQRLPSDADLIALQADLLIDQGDLTAAARQAKELRRLVPAAFLPDYLNGRIAVARGQWTEAAILLERCRKQLTPLSVWASRVYALLGLCHRHQGDLVAELAALRRAVAAEPGWPAARVALGVALLDNGRVEDALAELELARAAAESPKELWGAMVRALLARNERLPESQRRWSAVEAALERARAAQPDGSAITILEAEVLAARRDFDAARKALEQARERERKANGKAVVALSCALAELAEQQGNHALADRMLEEAEAERSDNVTVALTRCRLWSRRVPTARTQLAALADSLDQLDGAARTRVRRELAETWTRLGEPARAESLWRQVASDQPDDSRSRFALVELALRANQLDEARQLLTGLRKLEGTDGTLWRFGTAALRLVEARADRAKLAEARSLLQELERRRPDWGRVPLLLARADEMEGHLDAATRHYEQAIERGEAQTGVVTRLLELLLGQGEFLRAEEALGRALQQRPLTGSLARLGAEVAVGNGNLALARSRAERAVHLSSGDYRDYVWLAGILRALGETGEAEKLLREAVQQAGHVPDVWLALVELLAQQERLAEAEAVLTEASRKLPADRRLLTLARGHELMHKLADAEAEFEQAVAARLDDFIVLGQAAEFFGRQDRPELAEPLLRRLLAPDVAAPAERAALARRQLAVVLAARDRAAALNFVPGDSTADLRVQWFVMGQDPAQLGRAIAQFQESLRHQPATPADRLMLAELLVSAGKAPAARSVLEPLATQPAPLPQYLARYADVLVRTGDLDQASRHVAQLERWEPNTTRTRALQAALQKALTEKK
jgi:tetratricopeptide (TPR) repeat protein